MTDKLDRDNINKMVCAMFTQARKDYISARIMLERHATMWAGYVLYEDVRTFFFGQWACDLTGLQHNDLVTLFLQMEKVYNEEHKDDILFQSGLENMDIIERKIAMNKYKNNKTKLWLVKYYNENNVCCSTKILAKDRREAHRNAHEISNNIIRIEFERNL